MNLNQYFESKPIKHSLLTLLKFFINLDLLLKLRFWLFPPLSTVFYYWWYTYKKNQCYIQLQLYCQKQYEQISTTMPVAEDIKTIYFGFPTLSNSQSCFTTKLLSITSKRPKEKRSWMKLGKQVAWNWNVRKCPGETGMITTHLFHNQISLAYVTLTLFCSVLSRAVIIFKRIIFRYDHWILTLNYVNFLSLYQSFSDIHVIVSQNNGTSRQLWQ